MRRAVLVNGVPASGKSTVARLISAHGNWPLLALDTIKEPFFDYLGAGDREYNRRLGRASYHAIFDLIAGFPPTSTTVVDAWFGFQPTEVLTGHLARAGVDRAVEIWCQAPPATIAARYAARVGARPAGHLGLDYVPELLDLAGRARPTELFPCFTVDTATALDPSGLFGWLEAALATPAPAGAAPSPPPPRR